MLSLIKPFLAKGNHLAEAYDRMGQPSRVAQTEVEQPAEEQGQYDNQWSNY